MPGLKMISDMTRPEKSLHLLVIILCQVYKYTNPE